MVSNLVRKREEIFIRNFFFFFFETPQTEKFAGHDETTTAEEDAFLYEVIDVIDDAENTLLKENVLPSKYQCPGVKKCQISIFYITGYTAYLLDL